MECASQVAFEWGSSHRAHLVSQVAISKPRHEDERILLSGPHTTAHATVTVKGFARARFPADPSGRKEKVLSCVASPNSRDGHRTLAELDWHNLCRAIPALAMAQPDATMRVSWCVMGGAPVTVALPNSGCSGVLTAWEICLIWYVCSQYNVPVKLTCLKHRCLVLETG